MNQTWLDFLRQQYPAGSRIQLHEMGVDPNPIPAGTMGTLNFIDDMGTFHVTWDQGRQLGVVVGVDRFSVMPPKPKLLKLYMPLTAELFASDAWGETDDEAIKMDGNALRQYEPQIRAALEANQLPEEAERGLMHWYGDEDGVNNKVYSVFITVEERDNQLWGVAECRVTEALTQDELARLKDYIGGQASDGWGESFEQREIRIGHSELYVHFWNSDVWSIETEAARFAPKLDPGSQAVQAAAPSQSVQV